jgi:hypothetical protein
MMTSTAERQHDSQGWESRRLWSLWDMLTLNARYFLDLGAEFHDLSLLYVAAVEGKVGGRSLMAEELGGVQKHLEKVLWFCRELRLPTSYTLVSARQEYKKLPRTQEAFDILRDAVYAELRDKFFAYIPSDRLEYFDGRRIASDGVKFAFPTAYEEIRCAGQSYSFGLPTAAVFHAMRAVEIGVRTTGTALGVTFPYPIELAEWGKIVGEIEPKLEALKTGPRSAQKDADLKFYSEALSQFRHFNNGWRIRVSHARQNYAEDQAREVIDHVRSFFETLATRLKE